MSKIEGELRAKISTLQDIIGSLMNERNDMLKRMDKQRAELAVALSEVERMKPRWVRVEDGLPEEGRKFRIVYKEGGFIFNKSYAFYSKAMKKFYILVYGDRKYLLDVIAWLKMPDEPEFEE